MNESDREHIKLLEKKIDDYMIDLMAAIEADEEIDDDYLPDFHVNFAMAHLESVAGILAVKGCISSLTSIVRRTETLNESIREVLKKDKKELENI